MEILLRIKQKNQDSNSVTKWVNVYILLGFYIFFHLFCHPVKVYVLISFMSIDTSHHHLTEETSVEKMLPEDQVVSTWACGAFS